MTNKRTTKKAPADVGAYDLSDKARFDTLFDQFGNPTQAAVELILESSEKTLQSVLQLSQSAMKLIDRVKEASGLNERDRNAILDDIFAVLESSNDVQAWHENAYGMVRYRFANHATFNAKANAKKSAESRPKARAMRDIEKEWDVSGRPEVGKFAEKQARKHQLQGLNLSERGILNALGKYRKNSPSP